MAARAGPGLSVLACLDVHYRELEAVAALVLFERWPDAEPAAEIVEHLAPAAPYEPGRFFERELPCLLAVLGRAPVEPECVVVDSHAWLGEGRPGLGARLHEALGGRVAVIGVAKSAFAGAEGVAVPVLRGTSRRPLYVSAAGVDLEEAAARIRAMHGVHRLPTLLKRVDRLCREG